MNNGKIAEILREFSEYLSMEEISPKAPGGRRGSPKADISYFRRQAYERAASNIETLPKSVKEIYGKGGIKSLEKIPGVGKNIAEKIEEYLKTGKIKEYEKLKKKIPVDIPALSKIEGVGPKTVKTLYEKLKIKSVKDLGKAAKAGKISKLPNFGEKTEQNILQGLGFLKKSEGRMLFGKIYPDIKNLISRMKKLKEIRLISEAGSARRKKSTIGDADILVGSSSPKKVMEYFISLPGVVKVWGKGPTKSSVCLDAGFNVDLRVVPESQFGSALQYFTGSKEHNIVLRKIAISKGLKLNEYGLFKGSKSIAGKTEKEIYGKLGMNYIEPELRENTGEIEAARSKPNALPKLIKLKDIKGDLHCHSDWNGGENSIKEMAETAMEMGYEYIGISDHTQFLRIENGLNEKQLAKQRKEIDRLNSLFIIRNSSFRILQGCEANIMADGSIDINDEALAKLDYVIAGIHSQMKMSEKEMTNRIIRAMENKNVDIISHPTGELIGKRDACKMDFDKILKTAKKTGTILEINSSPDRLDLNGANVKKAKEAGVKMIINSDSHKKERLSLMEYGVGQARRGWAEKKDITNAWPLKKLKGFLKD
jgi:DNA polymerase (family 10)